ncbi:tRNA (adenosine(37)-N6)-threonylcarbamoyltransferase complex dimerization subunit type 1 TsaB [Pseudothermotoga thermarum]|uniref:Peptidase M22 glycoprotease n=1 Tax=Pseudothermotoga thermarum DSM 5069 TaxID=688269 RepID=F7YYS8_9THEM|nr:tRNA (adenosine(37)-N6)-threonylcarbamoyltransferase complex dimerization subunit type 1 TsaB [Pseudothermotoga thermarum]AEH51116.1 peptidase M22 glycoprotease [Pseudothermotoga thermarum DSM 5069]
MKILALDTSTDVLVVGFKDEEKFLSLTYKGIERHATKLAPMVKLLLDAAQVEPAKIDVLGCGVGPGSLTGLRIGISFVQGLACAFGKKITPVVSAKVLAKNFSTYDGEIVVARKAREGYVYIACYKNDEQIVEPTVKQIEEAKKIVGEMQNPMIVGDAKKFFLDVAKLAPDALENINAQILIEEVEALTKNGSNFEPALVQPLYLQKSIAEINFEKRKQG